MKCLTPSRLTEVLIGQGCLQGTTMVTCVGAQHKPMHEQTYKAMLSLAQALLDNPKDAKELMLYGDFPQHLLDAITDYEDDEE